MGSPGPESKLGENIPDYYKKEFKGIFDQSRYNPNDASIAEKIQKAGMTQRSSQMHEQVSGAGTSKYQATTLRTKNNTFGMAGKETLRNIGLRMNKTVEMNEDRGRPETPTNAMAGYTNTEAQRLWASMGAGGSPQMKSSGILERA